MDAISQSTHQLPSPPACVVIGTATSAVGLTNNAIHPRAANTTMAVTVPFSSNLQLEYLGKERLDLVDFQLVPVVGTLAMKVILECAQPDVILTA